MVAWWWKYLNLPPSIVGDTFARRAEHEHELEEHRRLVEQYRENTDEVHRRNIAIANFVALLKADGMKGETAVERARKVYGVSRATVFNAMKKRGTVSTRPDMATEERQSLIQDYEREAAERRSSLTNEAD
jgi:hypothetical protein